MLFFLAKTLPSAGLAFEAVLVRHGPEGEQHALLRDAEAGGDEGLEQRLVEVVAEAAHLARGGHLDAERGVGAGEAREGELRGLHAT
jgi:hypothetical protein